MTGSQFASYIRKQSKTNTATLDDSTIVLYGNVAKDVLAKVITEADEDYFGIQMVRDLEVGKRNYAFEPQQLNHMKYLECLIDGVNWQKASEIEINTLGITSDETSITNHFTGKQPGYEIFGGELMIYSQQSIIDVADGIKLWTIVYPKDITATSLADTIADLSEPPTTIDFGLPRQFHDIWADMVVIRYKNSQEKPIPLTLNEQAVPQRTAEAIDSIKGQNLDRASESSVPPDTGQDN